MSTGETPVLVGHRGAPREAPENTLSAFRRALEHGADAIELDVHATRDGVVVVHHDPVPRANTPAGVPAARPIAETSWSELSALKIGTVERIPSLGEVLDLVGRRARVYVEIKGRDVEPMVAAVLRGAGADCAVHSFDHAAIGRMRELAPEIPRGLLFDSGTRPDVAAAAARYGARDLWPHWSLVDATMISAARSAAARLIAWTVNDPAIARRLAAAGADALCTDDLPGIRASLAPGPEAG